MKNSACRVARSRAAARSCGLAVPCSQSTRARLPRARLDEAGPVVGGA